MGRDEANDGYRLLIALAEDANAAVDALSFRHTLIERLMHFVGADSGSLIPMPHPLAPDDEQCNATVNLEPGRYAVWQQNRRRYWSAMPAVITKLRRDGIVIDTEIYRRSDRERLAGYKEVLIPLGIRSILCTPVRFRGQATALLCLNRHAQVGEFGSRQVALLRSILTFVGLVDAAVLSLSAVGACHTVLQVLSPREREVGALIFNGLQNKEIALLLGTAGDTVRKQTRSIYAKLGVTGRVQLVARFGAELIAGPPRVTPAPPPKTPRARRPVPVHGRR